MFTGHGSAPFVTAHRAFLGNVRCADVSYHGERHAVNLVFVFGLVLSEGTVPEQERRKEGRGLDSVARDV